MFLRELHFLKFRLVSRIDRPKMGSRENHCPSLSSITSATPLGGLWVRPCVVPCLAGGPSPDILAPTSLALPWAGATCRPIESQRTREVLRVHVSSCCFILATAETAGVAARVLSSRTRELGSDSWPGRLRLRPGRLFSVFNVVCPTIQCPH
jgi:hypothetical protein